MKTHPKKGTKKKQSKRKMKRVRAKMKRNHKPRRVINLSRLILKPVKKIPTKTMTMKRRKRMIMMMKTTIMTSSG